MYFFFSLIPATILLVVGYFVLFSSTKAEGGVKTFGRILAAWIFILSAAFPIAGGYATYSGVSPISEMMQSMHPGEGA